MSVYDFHGRPLSTSGGNTGKPETSEGVLIEDLLYNFRKWNGKKFVLYGNSLTGWASYLGDYLGMDRVGLMVSGGSLTGNRTASELIELVDTGYPDEADLIILQGDGNTGWNGEPSDQLDGENPVNTWTARVNYLIRCLRAKYPNVVIAMMVDSVWYSNLVDQYQVEKNRTMYSQIKALCEYNRCAFFDVDHNTPFNPTHGFDNFYTGNVVGTENVDAIHPNKEYLKAKGFAVAQFVASLVFNPDAPNTKADGWQNKITYTITNNLTNVTNSVTAANWAAYTPYFATLTGANTVSVKMGGADVTADVYSNGRINIASVTGDVVITATA